MKSALVVSPEASLLSEMLERMSFSCVSAGNEKQLCEIDGIFDMHVIDTPPGEKLAKRFSERVSGQIVLLADEASFFDVAERLADCGVITVQKPVDERTFWAAIKTAEAAGSRYSRVVTENQRLRCELEDLKVINRAKLVLISRLSMTEPEAHRYIEKRSMDMRQTKRAVAESILKTYEF